MQALQNSSRVEPTPEFQSQFDDSAFRSSSQYHPGAYQGYDEVGTWVCRTFARFRAYRKQYDSNWYNFLNLVSGEHWPLTSSGLGGGNEFWKSRLVVNYIRSIVFTIIATAMDSEPKLSVSASDPFQQDYASGLESCLDSIWSRFDVSQEFRDALFNACTFGTGYVFTYYDPKAANGLGDVQIKELPTECVYPQPGCRRVSECGQLIIRRLESRAWLDEFFPDKAHLCKPSSTGDMDDMERYRQTANFQGGGGSNFEGGLAGGYGMGGGYGGDDPLLIDKTDFGNPPYANSHTGREPRYEILEMYVKDDTMDEETVMVDSIHVDALGMRYAVKTPHTYLKARYKSGWRHIFVCTGGRVTLEDKESPYDCIPIAKIVDESVPDEWFGRGECQNLWSLQLELDKRRAQMIDHASLNGGAVWLIDKNAEVNLDELTNRPGQIIQYRASSGHEIRREPGVPMPSFYLQMVEVTIRDMREISGVSAQAGGAAPKGVRSGAGFEASQAIATQRIRMRTHNLESAIRDTGRISIRMIQQFYTTPRWIRTVGIQGNIGFVMFDGTKIRGDWDLIVLPGSTMNQAQSAKEQRALELFKIKAIDQIALLQEINFHGRQEVVKRMGGQWPQQQEYPGYPGYPDRDSTNTTGYAFSVRQQPTQSLPGAGPPGGYVPPMGAQVAPIGGNPHFAPGGG